MSGDLQFVTFFVEERLYGLDIRVAKEINPTVEITRVPRTPQHIKGLVNIRGQVVLVMDIAMIFGRGPQVIGDDSQIVILKTGEEIRALRDMGLEVDARPFGDKPIGLLVDRIGDVVSVPANEQEPAPPHLGEANARYFSGVVKLGDTLLVILNSGEMLSYVGERAGIREERGIDRG